MLNLYYILADAKKAAKLAGVNTGAACKVIFEGGNLGITERVVIPKPSDREKRCLKVYNQVYSKLQTPDDIATMKALMDGWSKIAREREITAHWDRKVYREPYDLPDLGGVYNLDKLLRVLGAVNTAYRAVKLSYNTIHRYAVITAPGHPQLNIILREGLTT